MCCLGCVLQGLPTGYCHRPRVGLGASVRERARGAVLDGTQCDVRVYDCIVSMDVHVKRETCFNGCAQGREGEDSWESRQANPGELRELVTC